MKTSLTKKTTQNLLGLIFIAILLCIFSAPTVFAQNEFVSLSGVPQLEQAAQNRDIAGYLNVIYLLVIGLGALLAVIKISLAGVKYAMSDIVTNKAEAKKDIEGALLGLAIILLPYIVLTTINPNLVNLDILKNVQTIRPVPSAPLDSQTREQIRNEYGTIIETKSVVPASKDHIDFIKNCKGKVVKASTSNAPSGTYTLECRTKSSEGTTNSTQDNTTGVAPSNKTETTNTAALGSHTLFDPEGPKNGELGTVTKVSGSGESSRFLISFSDGTIRNVGCFNLEPVPTECN